MLRALILKLACTHPQNRKWILERLESSERAQVEPLLDEAIQLGLNSDIATVKAVLSQNTTPTATSTLRKDGIEGLDKQHIFWQRMLLAGKKDHGLPAGYKPLPSVPAQLAKTLITTIKQNNNEFVN